LTLNRVKAKALTTTVRTARTTGPGCSDARKNVAAATPARVPTTRRMLRPRVTPNSGFRTNITATTIQ
jgi:hypothetical protein